MKFETIKLKDGGEYKVTKDDNCIVVKQGKNIIWISDSLLEWLNSNK